ncbi:hypothetical protein K501DRAFT_270568 [Backusella circina FSU 941]|nr:hypothetical protein K501DRAFT_270568 [Backusella circina FSU 941]
MAIIMSLSITLLLYTRYATASEPLAARLETIGQRQDYQNVNLTYQKINNFTGSCLVKSYRPDIFNRWNLLKNKYFEVVINDISTEVESLLGRFIEKDDVLSRQQY